jgi:Coenzyme PQQ synthesis protein D (PqqD)
MSFENCLLPVSPIKPNPNVLSRRLGNDVVLFHLETDKFYELNGTAARFWELLNEGRNSDEIRHRLLVEFSVDPEQLDKEAAALVDSLRQEDLINGE